MLELDTRPAWGLGGEADLDLAGLVGVGLELPVRADIPAEHDAVRGVVGEDAGPAALASILSDVVDVPADLRVEGGPRDRGCEEVVLRWLEVPEALDEGREGVSDRRLDDDLSAHDGVVGKAHGVSSSVTSWYALSARFQKVSSWSRRARRPAALSR